MSIMKSTIAKKMSAYMCLVIWGGVIAFSQGLPDLTLCIGVDHAEIEVFIDGNCISPSQSSEVEKAISSSDHCGPCVDLILSMSSFETQLTDSQNVIVPTQQLSYPPLKVNVGSFIVVAENALSPWTSPVFNLPLSSPITVVLLI